MAIEILLVLLAVAFATDCSIDDDCKGDGPCFICDVDFNYCIYDFNCCELDSNCSKGFTCVESQCTQKKILNMKIERFISLVVVLPTGVLAGIALVLIFLIRRKKKKDKIIRAESTIASPPTPTSFDQTGQTFGKK